MKLVPIFEAVIRPHDFSKEIQTLIKTIHVESIEQLESIFNNRVKFITVKEFLKLNPNAKLPETIESAMITNGGIGAGTVINGKSYVICNPLRLIKDLDTYMKPRIVDMLSITLRHETVHIQQIEKSGGKFKDVDQASTPEEFKKYLANKHEIMAYARSVADELTRLGTPPQKALEMINQRTWNSNALAQYRKMFEDEPEVLNRLYKYIYQYLQDDIPAYEERMNKANSRGLKTTKPKKVKKA